MKDITLKQALELFLFDRETYCGSKTINNYKNTLRYFIDFLEIKYDMQSDKIKINDITKQDVQAYVVMLRNRDKLSTHDFKPTVDTPVTNTTIRTYTIDVRTFFHFLYNEEIIERDIMKNFKLIKREKKLIIPLYDDEVKTIDNTYNLRTVSGLRNYCIIHLMLDAGLRSGDVCNLKVDDIDFAHNQILIFNSKGEKDRVVPMAKNLRSYLYKYINIYRPVTECKELFLSVNGNNDVLTDNSIKSLFARIRVHTGIKRLKPHLLRHTFSTSFILNGGNMESLRLYLGHSSYDTTQMYLHLASLYQRTQGEIYKVDDILTKTFIGGY